MKTKEQSYKIYKLLHPETMDVKYIGATVNSLGQRLSHHIYTAKSRRGTIVSKWIWSLLQEELRPIIELVEDCNKDDWQDKEKYWISQYDNLYNQRSGGSGIIVDRSKASIQRSSESHEISIIQLSKDNEVVNIYDSVTKAAIAVNGSRTAIGNVLKGRANYSSGYHWIYKANYTPDYIPPELISSGPTLSIHQYGEDGNFIKTFRHITKVIKECGGNVNTLHQRIESKELYRGFYWSKNKFNNVNTNI